MNNGIVTVIIAIFAIGLVIVLAKYALFHPRVNSVLSIIALFSFIFNLVGSMADMTNSGARLIILFIFIIPYLISIADCIRDLIVAPYFYSDLEIKIDQLFAIKSITFIATAGLSRAFFLLVVYPILSHSVASEIERRNSVWYPLPCSDNFSQMQAKNYYYEKHIQKLERNRRVVSNKSIVDLEAKIRREKLDNLYPEKIVAKIADAVAGDKEAKEIRKNSEKKLESSFIKGCYAYINTDAFVKYPQLILNAMTEKGVCPLSSIAQFDELKPLKIDATAENINSTWSEYFIIKALAPLVENGEFEDNDFNDKDPFDNHAYRYAKSKSKMPSIDADSDPLLALDDD